jgi:Phosphate transporter family
MSEGLALSHGANDAQKAVGVVALLLVAGGELSHLVAPIWVELVCGAALTAGTALGGWRIVRTLGRRIIRIRPLDALSSQTGSTAVLLGASVLGAPVSTTQVVASSVVGVGGGRRRWRHVRWRVVRAILIAWLVTVPATAGPSGVRLRRPIGFRQVGFPISGDSRPPGTRPREGRSSRRPRMRPISSAQPVAGSAVLTPQHVSNDQPQALPRLRGPNRSTSLVSYRRRLWRSLL